MSGNPQTYPHVLAWLDYYLGHQRKHLQVLEAGCGGGQYANAVEPHTWIGFDLPDTWYDRVRPPTFYAAADLIPIASETIDLVFSVAAFDYFENPESVIKEFHRVLRPGGLCLIFTYDIATLQQIHKNCLALPQTSSVRGHHVTDEKHLWRMSAAAGFLSIRQQSYMPWKHIKQNVTVVLRPTNHRVFVCSKAVA